MKKSRLLLASVIMLGLLSSVLFIFLTRSNQKESLSNSFNHSVKQTTKTSSTDNKKIKTSPSEVKNNFDKPKETVNENAKQVPQENSVAQTTTSVFPEALLGQWEINDPFLNYIVTFNPDGTVTREFDGKVYTTKIDKLISLGNQLYRYEIASGTDTTALHYSGYGGHYVKYDIGILIDGDAIYPQVWSVRADKEFDYAPSYYMKATRPNKTPSLKDDTVIDTDLLEKTSLTAEKTISWIKTLYLSEIVDNSAFEENYLNSFYEGDDGLVYVDIRQNDDSASNSDSLTGLYRINDSDYLEKKDDTSGTWQVISKTYFE
ncbi:hypothetical protein [Streptococcus sp. CSL10205-OR2]|uniref:hypothetical protein n=1 Tax=Streptococcus sp. CSL10205-OR2 TaxID=2980558 RepID=UPI0021D8FBC1|nr:hypothetical protein [Streptococcus sp. CSL10205-OR2]MCU9533723.1 hypothetical protein [Streptococcus sp. CSL10205-OR2]